MRLVKKAALITDLCAKRPRSLSPICSMKKGYGPSQTSRRETSRDVPPSSTSVARRDWKTAVNATIAEFGKLDLLVNDAGISDSAADDLFDTVAWDLLMSGTRAALFWA